MIRRRAKAGIGRTYKLPKARRAAGLTLKWPRPDVEAVTGVALAGSASCMHAIAGEFWSIRCWHPNTPHDELTA
jgi:hypothetical protein